MGYETHAFDGIYMFSLQASPGDKGPHPHCKAKAELLSRVIINLEGY
jgi:hypothetical protein